MCSCANECVHVGPISTFDLNNSNSGVAQISNRACLWSFRSQTPRDRRHWPHVPSRTLLFKVFFVLSWMGRDEQKVGSCDPFSWLGTCFKAEMIGFLQYFLNFSDWPAVGHDGGVHQGAVAHDHHLRHRQLLQRDVCVHAGDHLHCDLWEISSHERHLRQAPFYPREAVSKGLKVWHFGLVFGAFEITVFLVSPLIGSSIKKIGVKVGENQPNSTYMCR